MSKGSGTNARRGPSGGATGRGRGGAARGADGGGGTSVGSEILAALGEVAEALESGAPLEHHFTVRTYQLRAEPRAYGASDVRRVRECLGLSQALFARFLGASLPAVRSWEQGKRPPSRLACRFLEEIEAAPGHWRERLRALTAVEESRPDREPRADRSGS